MHVLQLLPRLHMFRKRRASLDGLRAEVVAAKAALREAEAAEADAAKRVEAAEQRLAELKADQEEKRTQEDADEQRIQVSEGIRFESGAEAVAAAGCC